MKPSSLITALKTLVNAKRPGFVVSDPGMGKSQIMRQLARETGRKLFDIRLTGRDVVDLMGLPTVRDGKTHFARPAMLPTEADGPSILFLDELNRATQMMMNAGLQLVLDHRIGEHELPADCIVMAAGNHESDPGVIRMSSAMKKRLVKLDLEVNVDDWSKWAFSAGVDPIVIAFIRFRPELLHKHDAKEWASPCPRGWEFVSDIVKTSPDPEIAHALFAGVLGDASAVEFSGFYRLHANLPSIDAIALTPKTAKLPTDPSAMYAVAAAVARRIEAATFGRFVQYLERMPVEYNVLAVKCAVGRLAEKLTSAPEFTRWATDHSDVIF